MTASPDQATLDLYKLHADLADRVSARRATANAFFLTVQTSLIAVVGLVTADLTNESAWVRLVITLAGILLSACWWLSLRVYRQLNTAKFEVLQEVEKGLPIKVFTDEWAKLQTSPKPRFAELGRVERKVPWIFAALWVAMFLVRL